MWNNKVSPALHWVSKSYTLLNGAAVSCLNKTQQAIQKGNGFSHTTVLIKFYGMLLTAMFSIQLWVHLRGILRGKLKTSEINVAFTFFLLFFFLKLFCNYLRSTATVSRSWSWFKLPSERPLLSLSHPLLLTGWVGYVTHVCMAHVATAIIDRQRFWRIKHYP